MVTRTISTKYFVCIIALLLLGSLRSAPLYGQVAGATLSGVISDPSGRGIPGAKVSIMNSTTGVVRTVETDADGYYTAPNLLPGSYEINATAKGFSTLVQKGITLTVGANQALNLSMHIGEMSEKVEVSTAVPTVELATSTISGNVDATTVRELPLNGRDWTTLATLQPGVDTVHTQPDFSTGADRGNRGFGQQLTIS